ncbi:MAG: dipeptidase [Ignavibacteria bacterium]|nr:dipeptidase [Ignavibacteria bacterium]
MNIKKVKILIIIFVVLSGLFLAGFIYTKVSCNDKSTGIQKPENQFLSVTMDTNIFSPIQKFSNPDSSAFELHYDAVVVDGHNDYLYQVYKRGANFGKKDSKTQTGLPRLEEGGVDIQVFAIWIPMEKVSSSKSFVLNEIDILNDLGKTFSDRFEVAYNYNDITRIVSAGKLAGLTGIEGGTAIGNNLDNINEFRKLGVAYIGLTWNNSNNIGTSAKDETKTGKGGLTNFGKKVVQRMNETGMIIDVSHLGEKSFWDVIKVTDSPIIASHSNCYSINPHYRNLTDDQIKAVAETGGVIMVCFHSPFVSQNSVDNSPSANSVYQLELNDIYNSYKDNLIKFNEERAEFFKNINYKNQVSIDDVIDHIDHIRKLVGIDYIGIGSDFDGGINPLFDFYDGTCYPLLTKKLAGRGYTEIEIRKILGLNFLRVFKQVCG